MTRHLKSMLAAASLACIAAPALAQTTTEEPRTTYQVTMLKFAPGGADRWTELMQDHYAKAAKAAGLPETQVHWIMDGPWNIMLVRPMRRGMAALDAHDTPETAAYMKALAAQEGSEEAAKKINDEDEKLIADSMRFYTHTHP